MNTLFLNRFWGVWFLVLLGLLACSSKETASGTASEGESFVYGYVQDSSLVASALLRQGVATDETPVEVRLERLFYSDSGLVSDWSGSTEAAPDGYFAIEVPDSGVYTLQAQKGNVGAIQAEIDFTGSSVNLGRIGMYGLATVQGSFLDVPVCEGGLQLSLPGRPDFAPVDEFGTFEISNVPTGRSLLLGQCGDTVQQWRLAFPGRCQTLYLHGLIWNDLNVMGNNRSMIWMELAGIGDPSPFEKQWQWRVQNPIMIGDDCHWIPSVETGGNGQRLY